MSVEISSDFLLPNLFGGEISPGWKKFFGFLGLVVLIAVGIIIYHFSVVTSIEKNLTNTIIYSQLITQMPPQLPTQPPTQSPTGMSTRMPSTSPPTTR